MKKVISILIAIMMISTTALADTANGLREFLVKQSEITSFTGRSVLKADVNKPLEALDYIPEDEDINIDYPLMINDILDSEVRVNYACDMSDDYKKLQMSMDCEFNVPIHINDGLKLDAWAKTGIWYNCDFTDEKKPVFEIIVKTPFSADYLVGDIGKELVETTASAMNPEMIKKTAAAIADAINENASVTKTSKGYKIKFDSEGLGGFINSYFGIAGEYLPEDEKKEFEDTIQEMSKAFSGFDFLGDDGLTVSVAKNSNGELTACIEELHIDFNLCDFAEFLGEQSDGIERDKAQIDVTLRTTTEILGINKTKVTLPELTDENTTPMFSDYSGNYHTADKSPLFINDIIYYPVNEVIEKINAPVRIDANKVICGDAVLECDATQLITADDEVYVTEDVLEFIGVDYVDIHYYSSDEVFVFAFEYNDESYIEEEEWSEPQDYVPQTLVIDFDIDRDLYKNNNTSYMPVYEFVSAMYDGEFEFGNKSLTYTATKVNVHGIDKLTVRDGDKFVTVNGEKIALSAPAKEVNGVLNIPVGFAESYGYSGYVTTTYYTSGDVNTQYSFAMENPMFTATYEYPYIDLWVYSDRLPHLENGEVCVPLYDFLIELYDGEFSFTENGMEYAATGENEMGITKVSVTVGDKFVMVDDKRIELENQVVRINDVIRVPIGFVEALGFGTDWISVYNNETTYSFSMPNPKYNK